MDVTISSSELEHLRQIEKWFPCDGGCGLQQDGFVEDCSRHGRPPTELWEIIRKLRAERDRLQSLLEEVRELVVGHPETPRRVRSTPATSLHTILDREES